MHEDKLTPKDEAASPPYLDGIVCDVTNCVYNEHNRRCTAPAIKVGPNFAATKNDTSCSTFERR